MSFAGQDISKILQAAVFASERHSGQLRKGAEQSPYINHPLKVAEMLWSIGEVRDIDCIVAALLHDTVEDTTTTPLELEEKFGERVRLLVTEVTDDKSLPKAERKQLQIQHARHISMAAKQIKLADKSANIFDVAYAPAPDWSHQRREEYLDWANAVVAGLRGCNPALEKNFDQLLHEARKRLQETQNLSEVF
jgi:guanosine-3',5'-bis(diphosphate) 3'-pyrophosphohydrolase